MAKMINLKIDNVPVSVPEGTLIVDAAKKIGIDIPVFCYHPKMQPVGMCRMCLVSIGRPVIDRTTGKPVLNEDGTPKVQFAPKLETACTTPVSEGMVVDGLSKPVQDARKDVVEFILTSHPLDCPICDKGGECPLQNLTMAHGPGTSRFLYDEKMHMQKHVPLGEMIFLDRERCIQCGRCVRFQDEIVGEPVIGFHNRGRSLEIVTFSDPGFDSYFSGNTTDICPVGALTTADFRFGARPWELKATASVCNQCPVGCNITFNVRREAKSGGNLVIKRVMPRQNEQVNEIWICDKGRFAAYPFVENPERLTQPLIRQNGKLTPASWEAALTLVAEKFAGVGGNLVILAGGRLSNEDLFTLKGLGGKNILHSFMAGGDVTEQFGLGQGSNLSELGKGDAILVVASDLQEEAPIWWLRVKQAADRGAQLIVLNPRATKLDAHATHVLRYTYGEETASVLKLVNAVGTQRTRLPEWMNAYKPSPEEKAAAQAFAQARQAVIFFGQEGATLESTQALAQACAGLLFATNHDGKVNCGLVGVWQHVNTQGAWELGFRPDEQLAKTLAAAKAAYIVAADPAGDDPALARALKQTGFVVVQELFLTETAQHADVVLPAQAYTERDGSYTSGERRVQRFYPAIPPLAQTRPDYVITAQIGEKMGLKLEGRSASLVFNQIAAQIPAYEGLNYRKLAEVTEQFPIIGRGDLYYGGTAYENKQGLGVQLMPSGQKRKLFSINWQQPKMQPHPEGLLAVPITCLYDQSILTKTAPTLQLRLTQPQVWVSPQDAAALGLMDGALVAFSTEDATVEVMAKVNAQVPAGYVLTPRNLGIPLYAPMAVVLRSAVPA